MTEYSVLLSTLCIVSVRGQAAGVNVKVPIPILDDLFGDSETPHQHRWWFWVIIAIIAAFSIVALFFTARGCLRYRALYPDSAHPGAESGYIVNEKSIARRTGAVVCGMPVNHRLENVHRKKMMTKVNPRGAADELA